MALKDSNEITVRVLDTRENVIKLLKNKGFTIEKIFSLDDYYMIPNNLDIENMSTREIISKAVLVRGINREDGKGNPRLTFKRKDINENGEILSQEAINCDIFDVEEGRNFMKAIGYKDLINIYEDDIVYHKGDLSIEIKDVRDGDILIEIETNSNTEFDTIDKLKDAINELQISIEPNQYFVKKAEVQLNKMLNR